MQMLPNKIISIMDLSLMNYFPQQLNLSRYDVDTRLAQAAVYLLLAWVILGVASSFKTTLLKKTLLQWLKIQ